MEIQTPRANTTHPMILVAATAVTALSLAGLAALFGWLPAGGASPATPVAPVAQLAGSPADAGVAPPAAAPEKSAAPNARTEASTPAPTAEARPARRAAAHPAPIAKATPTTMPPPPPRADYGGRGATPVSADAGNAPINDSGIYAENSRSAPPLCRECGTVESVREIAQEGQGSPLGAIAGGVLGGVLGHQVGNGRGRDVATVVGALGGAFAGHTVEKNVRSTRQYQITVRFDDGSRRTVTETNPPQWQNGDRVRLDNERLSRL